MSVEVKNVSYTYSPKTPNAYDALCDISMLINDGDYLTIVGQTGSGKSTLVQMLNGLTMPSSGAIFIDGVSTQLMCKKKKTTRELRKKIGLVFQFPEYQLFEETVLKDVAFGPKNFGLNSDESIKQAKEALREVGIGEKYYERSPFELSGGEKRRVAIAGILAINPDVLVLDEPTAGLDPEGVNQILSLINKLNSEGKTIILVTHDMDIVVKLAKRVIVLEKGRITFDGNPYELFNGDCFGLEIPYIYKFTNILNKGGYNIPLSKIHSINDLLEYIKK